MFWKRRLSSSRLKCAFEYGSLSSTVESTLIFATQAGKWLRSRLADGGLLQIHLCDFGGPRECTRYRYLRPAATSGYFET